MVSAVLSLAVRSWLAMRPYIRLRSLLLRFSAFTTTVAFLSSSPSSTTGFSVAEASFSVSENEALVREDSLLLHTFNGPLSGTTRVSQYQKGKTNLDFTEARDREWQWHQLGRMQVCTSRQTDNHASTPPLSFLQAGYPSCYPTNSVKALKAREKIV